MSEVELKFGSGGNGDVTRVIASGIDLTALPALQPRDYSQGLYRPIGIGAAHFSQAYEDLEKRPPERSPFFSLMLDGKDRWLDHRKLAVDGVVLHRDPTNAKLVHVYLLSYEQAALIDHLMLTLDGSRTVARRSGAASPQR